MSKVSKRCVRTIRGPVLTQNLIGAIGCDVGNASMRRAGRSVWNRSDYRAAARKANELFAASIGAASTSEADIVAAIERSAA